MYRAEVIAIGDEVVNGMVVNANAAHIARKLFEIGFSIEAHHTVADDATAIHALLNNAVHRAELLILTGGLGPTLDDKTREVLAEFFECEIIHRPEVMADLERRYGGRAASAADQARQPTLAEILFNPVGTAPGLLFNTPKGVLIALPGVPNEMRALLSERVIPRLEEFFANLPQPEVTKVNVCLARESDVDVELRKLVAVDPSLTYGIYPHQGSVSVHLKRVPGSTVVGQTVRAAKKVQEIYGPRFFEAESGEISEAIHNYFIKKGLSLSLAESCTGGALGARLTSHAGASAYFLGSVVSYSYELKELFLGVQKATLDKHGAVSEATVREMADGILLRTGSDFSVAVSGIAGPAGGTPEKPVGTIWFAVGRKGGQTVTHHIQLPGSREAIINRSVIIALGFLWMEVQK